jgi:hypothetical protein
MIMITLIAALTLASTAPQASEAETAMNAMKECIATNAIRYAKGSKESADVLADLVIYKCNDGTSMRAAAMRVVPARLMALDAIVTTRMGGI